VRITDLVEADVDDLAAQFEDWPKERSLFAARTRVEPSGR
jgi:hypothetical protein